MIFIYMAVHVTENKPVALRAAKKNHDLAAKAIKEKDAQLRAAEAFLQQLEISSSVTLSTVPVASSSGALSIPASEETAPLARNSNSVIPISNSEKKTTPLARNPNSIVPISNSEKAAPLAQNLDGVVSISISEEEEAAPSAQNSGGVVPISNSEEGEAAPLVQNPDSIIPISNAKDEMAPSAHNSHGVVPSSSRGVEAPSIMGTGDIVMAPSAQNSDGVVPSSSRGAEAPLLVGAGHVVMAPLAQDPGVVVPVSGSEVEATPLAQTLGGIVPISNPTANPSLGAASIVRTGHLVMVPLVQDPDDVVPIPNSEKMVPSAKNSDGVIPISNPAAEHSLGAPSVMGTSHIVMAPLAQNPDGVVPISNSAQNSDGTIQKVVDDKAKKRKRSNGCSDGIASDLGSEMPDYEFIDESEDEAKPAKGKRVRRQPGRKVEAPGIRKCSVSGQLGMMCLRCLRES